MATSSSDGERVMADDPLEPTYTPDPSRRVDFDDGARGSEPANPGAVDISDSTDGSEAGVAALDGVEPSPDELEAPVVADELDDDDEEDVSGEIDPESSQAPERAVSDTQVRNKPAAVRSGGSWGDKASPALHVGRTLAERWKVGDRIGMGGMASVHRSDDLRLDRPVAVKILHPHIAENADARARLAREARAIAQLKHESVIEVYDYDISDPDCTWLVTELIEGGSLREVLEHCPQPMPEVATMIVSDILRALRAAHDVGVVHRDVKPDNVLIGKSGRPKLSDFGIAQVVSEERMTLTGNLVGSPSYMSPEQAEGRRTDHRTDLFSAGVVLYRLVTGKLPFAGQNAIETLRRVASTQYVDPSELDPNLPSSILGVIRKSLAPRIEHRYQSADEMLADLGAILRDAGLNATSDELPRFFRDPEVYQLELARRLAKELVARGQALLDAGEEARALDCFNRAMALGANNEQTLDLVNLLSKRRERGRLRRVLWMASAAAGVVLMVGGGLFASEYFAPGSSTDPARAQSTMNTRNKPVVEPIVAPSIGPTAPVAIPVDTPDEPHEPDGPDVPARLPVAAPVIESQAPAPTMQPVATPTRPRPQPRRAVRRPAPSPAVVAKPEVVAEPVVAPAPAPVEEPEVEVRAAPKIEQGMLQIGTSRWADIYIDGVRLGRAPEQTRYGLPPGRHRLKAVNPHCNPLEKVVTIRPDQTTRVRLKIDCP